MPIRYYDGILRIGELDGDVWPVIIHAEIRVNLPYKKDPPTHEFVVHAIKQTIKHAVDATEDVVIKEKTDGR